MDKPLTDRNKDTKIVEKVAIDRRDPSESVNKVGGQPVLKDGVKIIGQSQ